MRLILTLILALPLAAQLDIPLMSKRPFDYYVDSVNGNDANAGRSMGSAWKTIAKWAEHTQRAGEKTCLVRGSTWREQMTVAANSVTVAACGVGEKPLLDASDVIAAEAWSKTGGLTNVYQATLSPTLAASNTYNKIWEDGSSLARVADAATCDTTPGSYVPSSDTVAPITMYVHTSDSANPAENGAVYEFAARNSGFYANAATGATLRGIHARRNLFTDGSIIIGPSGLVSDSLATDGSKHSIFLRKNARAVNTSASGAYYPSGGSLFVAFDAWSSADSIRLDDCTADMPGPSPSSNIAGFLAHGTGSLGSLTLNGFTATNTSSGISISETSAVIISRGSLINNGTRGIVVGAPVVTISNWSAEVTGASRAIDLTLTTTNLTLSDSTLLCSSPSSANAILSTKANTVINVSNTVFNNAGGSGISFTAAGASLTASGNTYTVSGNYYYFGNTSTIVSDYNTFVTPGTGVKFVLGGVNKTLIQYRADTSQDAHSTPLP